MSDENQMLTFGGHLEVLRRMLFRVLIVTAVFACAIFCFKNTTFYLLLAPSKSDFILYRWIEQFLAMLGSDFHFAPFEVDLIATDLSSQFMTHISTSLYLGFPHIFCLNYSALFPPLSMRTNASILFQFCSSSIRFLLLVY